MAANQSTTLHCTFNGSVSVEGRAARLSAHAGVLALRELDERLGLSASIASQLDDPRDPTRVVHSLLELLRSRLYLIACGHRHQLDSDLLRDDPACRLAVSERRGISPLLSIDAEVPAGLPSQPSQSRLLDILARPDNLPRLRDALLESARRFIFAERGRRIERATLDIDSLPLEVHGHQPGSAYNSHYGCRCFHPLAVFLAERSLFLDLVLRPGNVHTADGATEQLLAVIDRAEAIAHIAAVRGDAGFPSEGLFAALEARGVDYVFRLRKNSRLNDLAAPLLRRPVGRPPDEPREWIHEISYRAGSWSRSRRVVIVVVERPGELFLDWFALITSWHPSLRSGEQLLEFYRARGTTEAHLGELQGLDPALSSSPRPKSQVRGSEPQRLARREADAAERVNDATLLLNAIAYNLLSVARRVLAREIEPDRPIGMRLHTLQVLLLTVAARVAVSGRRITIVVERATAQIWSKFWRGLRRLRPLEAFHDSS